MKVEHPGYSAGRRYWPEVESSSSWFPACQQHLRFPFPWDHQVRPGSVGTTASQEEDLHLQVSPPHQFHHQWWLALHPTRIFHSLTSPSGPAKLLVRSGSCKAGACRSWGCSRWASKNGCPG